MVNTVAQGLKFYAQPVRVYLYGDGAHVLRTKQTKFAFVILHFLISWFAQVNILLFQWKL